MDTQMNTQAVENNYKKEKKKLKWWYPGKGYQGESNKTGWEVNTYYRKFRNPTISLRVSPASYFDNRLMIHLDLMWVSWYIHLPIYSTIEECEYPEFGFYYHSNSLVLCWNMAKKFINMPWQYDWVRTSKLKIDGSWYTESRKARKKYKKSNPGKGLSDRREEEEIEKELWKETHHYKYTTKYGTVQDDIDATIGVEEREWRPRWFRWTKMFRKVRKSIEIEFSNEVGSERGSWKGGCIGCSYEMLPGEIPYNTLMRMQRERSFDR